ncbi:MAG TPA: DUF5671 domain-containing protein [Candidatus Tumulicola sp.]
MSVPSDMQILIDFITAAKSKGTDDRFVASMLRQNGWSDRRIFAAFSSYYETVLGIPTPVRAGRLESSRDAFFYLLAFVTLSIWTVAFVWLANVLVDRAFPSALDLQYGQYAIEDFRVTVAGQLASIIVAFPIFLFVSRAIVRETRQRPESLDSGVRKWLTYIALVVTALTLLGDGVWFLREFLVGDLTVRFVVKSLVLFAVAGGVFWYYLGTVRTPVTRPQRDLRFGIAACAAVILAVALGFSGIGSPAHQRLVAFDLQRVDDLQTIASTIQNSYAKKHALPRDLNEVSTIDSVVHVHDPQTRALYRYIPGTRSKYRLCATFGTDAGASPGSAWKHAPGYTCYPLDATADTPPTS